MIGLATSAPLIRIATAAKLGSSLCAWATAQPTEAVAVATPRFRVVPKRTRSLAADIIEFGEAHGVHLDVWQQDAVDAFSGIRGRAKAWASTTNVLLVPRQNGKSMILILRALFGLFVLRRKFVLFSSHTWASSNESFLVMKDIIECNPDLAAQVKATRLSAAQLGFELHDGASSRSASAMGCSSRCGQSDGNTRQTRVRVRR